MNQPLTLLKVGECFHPEAMVMKGHSWKSMAFPAIVGLIKHPKKGYILFDTGYAKRFQNATQSFPERIYRWLTPMHLCDKQGLTEQLRRMNIQPSEIKTIIISHFHADHIAGLLDFPKAHFVCSKVGFEAFSNLSPYKALSKGYLPELLPLDFTRRVSFIEDCCQINLPQSLSPFQRGWDLLGDNYCLAVSLPGHAHGHFGLMVNGYNDSSFLVGDACWTREAFMDGERPNRLTKLIMSDSKAYLQTIERLSQLYKNNPTINIIPSHCMKTFQQWQLGEVR